MIRALLSSPLGFVVGLSVGALGSGGSILAVPALVYVAGLTPQAATATSLFMVGVACLSGLPAHYRAGRVKPVAGAIFGFSGIGGSFAGTALNHRIDPHALMLAFAALIFVAVWRMLTACPSCTRTGEEAALRAGAGPALHAGGAFARRAAGAPASPHTLTPLRVVAILATGTAIGFLTGLFGVGGGFVIVPALTLLLGYAMPQAIGTSLLVVAINTVMALAARFGSSHVDWVVAGTFTATAVVGVLAGGRMADCLDAEKTLRIFAAVLLVLAIFTSVSAIYSMTA